MAAREVAALAREHAAEGDRERRLAMPVVEAMSAGGLFGLAVPREAGGLELDPVESMRVLEAVSEGDGAAGWTLMIGVETGGIVASWATDEAAAELFGPGNRTVVSGALNPVAKAVRTNGGWLVTGQWPFCSGCMHSTWFFGGAVLHDGDDPRRYSNGQPRWIEFLIPHAEYEVVDTWQVAGLRGTGSHDVRVANVFVPDHRTLDVYGERHRRGGALNELPMMVRLASNKVGVATGIARAAIDHFVDLAGAKAPRLQGGLLRERPFAQTALAEAETALGSARAWVFETVADAWATVLAGEKVSPRQHALVRLACSHAAAASAKAVELVCSAAGASANFSSSPLERCFRDVHVVPGHLMVAPHMRDLAGRVLLGLEPGTVAF